MRLRQTIGFSLALLLISGGAVVKPAVAESTEHRHTAKKPVADNKKPVKAFEHQSRAQGIPSRQLAARRVHARHGSGHQLAEDRPIGPVQSIGAREFGTAAWYGGRHLGRRTASGDRLDAIRATAAHRTLPLRSLARVTNLNNGRSCIVVVTDRGPTSRRLLIDLSPRAADALDMRHDGVVPVTVEPVAAVADAQN